MGRDSAPEHPIFLADGARGERVHVKPAQSPVTPWRATCEAGESGPPRTLDVSPWGQNTVEHISRAEKSCENLLRSFHMSRQNILRVSNRLRNHPVAFQTYRRNILRASNRLRIFSERPTCLVRKHPQ